MTSRLSTHWATTLLVTGMLTIGGWILADPADFQHSTPQHVELMGDSFVSEAQRRGLLRVGFDLFEPWTMCDVNGELIGHEIDVARKIADDMGVRLQFVQTEWYFILAALVEERFDIIVSGMSITADRALLINFSVPVGESGTAIVANIAATADLADYNHPDVIIAARPGTTTEAVVQSRFPNATLLSVSTPEEMLQAILDGTAHAAAVSQTAATRWIVAHPETLHNPFDQQFNPLPEAIALRKGDFDGLNFLNSWITQHRTNGWLEERRRYWFETRDWEDQVARDENVISACVERLRSASG